jgi:hypothetical protein
MAMPRVNALGLSLGALTALSGHLLLQKTEGDQQAQLSGKRPNWVFWDQDANPPAK